MLAPVPTALTFTAAGRSAPRLAELLAGQSFSFDLEVLGLRANGDHSPDVTRTPYLGVSCKMHASPASAHDDEPIERVRSPLDAAHRLRARLSHVVDRTIGSARRVAVLTGGGLDSAGLLALAVDWAKRTGGSAFAVALDFGGPGDDRPHLEALQAMLGCEVVRVRPEEATHRLPELVRGVDGAPFSWPIAPMEIELLARAKAHGADCVLSGGGGDDLFDGNPRALAALARRGRLREAARMARRLRGFSWHSPRSPLASWVLRPLLARVAPVPVRLLAARRAPVEMHPWSGPVLQRLAREARARAIAEAIPRMRRGIPVDGTVPDCSPARRAEMAWSHHQERVVTGLGQRHPYLDPGLIALVASFPPDWLLHGGIRRGLFREAFRGWLPESLRMREDKAEFTNAFARMVGGPGGLAPFRALSRDTELASVGIVDAERFAECFDALAAAPDRWQLMPLWSFLCTEALLRTGRGRASC